jgi:hypothetical protein
MANTLESTPSFTEHEELSAEQLIELEQDRERILSIALGGRTIDLVTDRKYVPVTMPEEFYD